MSIPILAADALKDVASKEDLTQALSLLEFIQDGDTVAEAAAKLGISRGTAFRRLRLVEVDADEGVVKLLRANGLQFAEDWRTASEMAAVKGDHRPAKDALIHAKLIEPVEDGSQGRTNIAIIIGTPEHPLRIEPPQVVDASVVGETS